MLWVMSLITLSATCAALIVLFRGMRRAQSQLLESNQFLDSLIENLPVMVFIKDAKTLRYVRQNRATLELLGLSKEDVIGKLDADFLPKPQADFVLAMDRKLVAAGTLVDVPEQSIQSRALGVRILHTRKVAILDDAGQAKFLLGISVDITERKLAELEIQELNRGLQRKAAQLEAANRDLESFSYSVSHDLRAPLRAIAGFAQMLEEDCHGQLDDAGNRYLSLIRANSRRMSALIDDLLKFSQMGRKPVAKCEVDMHSLVREVAAECLQGIVSNNPDRCAPQIEIGALPAAVGDGVLLRQVWANLLDNALKYSGKSDHPLIQVSGEQVGGEMRYLVRDNGVGFDMQYAENLFGVFQRLHKAEEFIGTGVGLAIVHRVVTRHGGRVWAEAAVGCGALFSFALPIL